MPVLHLHVVPRASTWPDHLLGPGVMQLIGGGVEEPLRAVEVEPVASRLRQALRRRLAEGA